METSFGYRTVEPGQKQPLVDDVFRKVAERYDLMNDIIHDKRLFCRYTTTLNIKV